MKANAEVEREQIVRVVRGQVEAEKEIAILETKKKKWVSQFSLRITESIIYLIHILLINHSVVSV